MVWPSTVITSQNTCSKGTLSLPKSCQKSSRKTEDDVGWSGGERDKLLTNLALKDDITKNIEILEFVSTEVVGGLLLAA